MTSLRPAARGLPLYDYLTGWWYDRAILPCIAGVPQVHPPPTLRWWASGQWDVRKIDQNSNKIT